MVIKIFPNRLEYIELNQLLGGSFIIKSLKWQFIVSILVAIGFVYINFSTIEFIEDKRDPAIRVIFFLIMIFSVFNAGLLSEKYIQSKKR